jgi:hypothetical protein
MLKTTWYTDVPAGRPPRHLWRLTGSGRQMADELAADARGAASRLPELKQRWQGA